MNPLEAVAIMAAGLFAGTINTIVGSGSLVTFPTMLAFMPSFGYTGATAALVANVSNTVGLVPGSLSGVVGYRHELHGQRGRIVRLGAGSIAGGITGAVLLLVLPAAAFGRIVPALIILACLLVAVQPRLSRIIAEHRGAEAGHSWTLWLLVFGTGIYGGYFGAAQGVILIALLGIFVDDDLQRLNALKNVLAVLVNGVAAILFILRAPVAWPASVVLAIGAIVGGQVGAQVGRRIPPLLLRVVIIVVGSIVSVGLLLR